MKMTSSWQQVLVDAYNRPANVDWCEANYVSLDWVAEAWNTFSSIPMSFIALYGKGVTLHWFRVFVFSFFAFDAT